MERKQEVTGYYRSWCNTLALFYDALTGALGLFVGGERRFREKIAAAANLQRGDRVLDVGCGTGTLAALMAQRVGETGEVVGIDLSPRMLAVARRKANLPQLTLRRGNAEAIP
jgi:ubiquinone/menaquinone biosynthesis C-methylase UbiE